MADHLMFSEHMHSADFDHPIRSTYLGQAHIAGTGPTGTTCRQCRFWHKWKPQRDAAPIAVPPGYFGRSHKSQPGGLKKAHCNRPILNKAKRMIPHSAQSCRLFEAAENPPLPAMPDPCR